MFKRDILDKFGTQQQAAQAAGVTQPRVSAWGEVVPEHIARRLHDWYPDLALHEEHYPAPARVAAS